MQTRMKRRSFGIFVLVAMFTVATILIVYGKSFDDIAGHYTIGTVTFILFGISFWAWLVRRDIRRNRRDRRKAKGLCPCCGYDLRETRSQCPECGTVVGDMRERE